MNKTILYVVLSLVLLTLTSTSAYAEDGSGQADGTYTVDPSDYSSYFMMLNRNIDYQSFNFTYAIPMKAGDSLYVDVNMSENATYQCLDPVGFALLMEGNGSEENWNEVLNHTLLNFTEVNSSNYEAFATATEDTWFCLVIWPEDTTKSPTGNITAIRCSQSEEDIGPGINGSEFMNYFYTYLNKQQQTDSSKSGEETSTTDTSTLPEDKSYGDTIPWVPDMSAPDIPIYSSSTVDEFGPITGPNLSSTSIADQDDDYLGIASGVPITGLTGNYTPYYSSAYSSPYLNEAFQEAQDSWHRIEMERVKDQFSYFNH